MNIEFDREEDGRCIADVPEVPGALAYGASYEEAAVNAISIALTYRLARVFNDLAFWAAIWAVGQG